MGNALSKEDIAWQLEQMRAQGIGGVEQITIEPVYERGNHPYLSEAYLDLVRPNIHALPLATMKRIEEFVKNAGVAIGLEQVPSASTGLENYRERDAEVRAIATRMFRAAASDGNGAFQYGDGHTISSRT